MLNKKAQVEDLLPLLLVIVLLVFMSFLPSCMNASRGIIKAKIELHFLSKDSDQLLINFLGTPFYLDNVQDSNVADALNIYFLTDDIDLYFQLDEKANEFFSKSDLESDYATWELRIKHPRKHYLFLMPESIPDTIITKKQISEIAIPTYNHNEFIEIQLFLYK